MSDSGPKTSEKIVSPYIPASLVRAATFRSIAGVPIIQGSSRDIASGALPEEAIAARLPKPRIDGSIVKSWLRRMFQGWLEASHHVMPMQIVAHVDDTANVLFSKSTAPSLAKKRVADRAYCPFQISGSCPIYHSGVAPADGRVYDPSQSDIRY
jgi:hypothetical protein